MKHDVNLCTIIGCVRCDESEVSTMAKPKKIGKKGTKNPRKHRRPRLY